MNKLLVGLIALGLFAGSTTAFAASPACLSKDVKDKEACVVAEVSKALPVEKPLARAVFSNSQCGYAIVREDNGTANDYALVFLKQKSLAKSLQPYGVALFAHSGGGFTSKFEIGTQKVRIGNKTVKIIIEQKGLTAEEVAKAYVAECK